MLSFGLIWRIINQRKVNNLGQLIDIKVFTVKSSTMFQFEIDTKRTKIR